MTQPSLLSIGEVSTSLSHLNPLTACDLFVDESVPKFSIDEGWAKGLESLDDQETVAATLTIGEGSFPLTKNAMLDAASLVGITKKYAAQSPADLTQENFNYWYSVRHEDIRALTRADGTIAAFAKKAHTPLSDIDLLSGVVKALGTDGDWKADPKVYHDAHLTAIRLVSPKKIEVLADDDWSVGVEIRNSLSGKHKTSIRGYLFRYVCTNGATVTASTGFEWTPKKADTEDAYTWASTLAKDILLSMDHEMDQVKGLAAQSPQPTTNLIRDVFEKYKIPPQFKTRIVQRLVEADLEEEATPYDVMNAVTSVANDPDLPETVRMNLMAIGGDLPSALTKRCGECKRLVL